MAKRLAIDPERAAELRRLADYLDPGGRKALEVQFYDLRDGEQVLTGVAKIDRAPKRAAVNGDNQP